MFEQYEYFNAINLYKNPNDIRKAIRNRKQAYGKAKRTNSIEHWILFKRARNKITTLLRPAKQSHFNKQAQSL